MVEWPQLLNVIGKLGLQNNKLLVVVLSSRFNWKSVMAYGLGCLIVLFFDEKPYYRFHPSFFW
jgi:hypothetical protein